MKYEECNGEMIKGVIYGRSGCPNCFIVIGEIREAK